MEEKQDNVLSQYPPTLPPEAAPEDRAHWITSQLELYELALNAIHDGVVVTDHVGGITYLNPAAAELFLRQPDEMIGERIFHWFEDRTGAEPVPAIVERGETVKNRRVSVRRSDGGRVSALLTVTPMMSHGRMVRVIGLFRDQTEVERVNEELRRALEVAGHLARTDEKTGLLNERAYREHLERATVLARRRGDALGVVMIDSNGLKQINDTYTYEAGDIVIREIGAAIRRTLYETDTAARLHGDEFALILPMTSKTMPVRDQMSRVMEKLARALTFTLPLPIADGSAPVVVNVTVGMGAVVRVGQRIPDPDVCLGFATHALHESKRRFREAPAKRKGSDSRWFVIDSE